MPRVLVVLPTSSYRTGDFLDAARALGVELAVASEEVPPLDLGDRYVRVDLDDPHGSALSIVALADHTPIDAVVAVDDAGVEMAAHASRALGLPSHPPEAAAATRDKLMLRRLLQAGEVPQPRFAPVGDDPARDVAALEYPIVIKPRSGTASRGVLRVDGPTSLDEIVGTVRSVATEMGETGPLLAEEYLAGDEYALEGMLTGGRLTTLAVFDKPDTATGPTFEETILVTPSSLGPDEMVELERLVAASVRAVGLSHGPIHAEVRRDGSGRLRLLEVAARSIGGLCGRALRFGLSGSTLEQVVLATALGLPAPTRQATSATGILMLPVSRGGTLQSVEGVEEVTAMEGITDVVITVPGGTPVRSLPFGDRYLGFVFATGPDPATVTKVLREAGRRLHPVVTGPAPSAC
jgi:biotin carboxylase